MTAASPGADSGPLSAARSTRRGDSLFRSLTLSAGVVVFALLTAIAVFLVVKALPALHQDESSFLTTKTWTPDSTHTFGIAALVFGTLLSSALALVMAVPVAIGVALYVTNYAPRRVATLLGYATDMLAAVPSVVFGLWGLHFLLPRIVGLQVFLNDYFGWIPLFAGSHGAVATYSKSIFGAAIILAIMIAADHRGDQP